MTIGFRNLVLFGHDISDIIGKVLVDDEGLGRENIMGSDIAGDKDRAFFI